MFKLASSTISSIVKNTKRRLQSFGKHKKDIGIPIEQSDFQDYLKTAPKDFRKYNRKSKMYEPRIPRGKAKESDEYQLFIRNVNEYLNTTDTYQTISRFINQYQKFNKGIEDMTATEAQHLMELSDEVKRHTSTYVGTNNISSKRYAGFDALIYARRNGANLSYDDMLQYYNEHEQQFENMAVNEIYNFVESRFNTKADIMFGDDF